MMLENFFNIRVACLAILLTIPLSSLAGGNPSSLYIPIDGLSPYYSPYTASVTRGIPVVWKNPTASPHTVTHDGCKGHEWCAFDSGAILPGGSFQVPSLPPGLYPYFCTLHPIMRGMLEVKETPIPAST